MTILATLTAATLWLAGGQADEPPLQEIGRWSLARTDHSCSLQAYYQDGTTLRVIASDVDSDFAFVLLNPTWRSLGKGDVVNVEIKFPGFATWNVSAVGLEPVEAGHAIGFQQDSREAFVAQFALAEKLDLLRDGLPVTSLAMTGSRRAVQELIDCQVGLRTKPGFDPFHTFIEVDPGDPA